MGIETLRLILRPVAQGRPDRCQRSAGQRPHATGVTDLRTNSGSLRYWRSSRGTNKQPVQSVSSPVTSSRLLVPMVFGAAGSPAKWVHHPDVLVPAVTGHAR